MLKPHNIVRLLMALAMAMALGRSIHLDTSHVARAALGSGTSTVIDGSTGEAFYLATIIIEPSASIIAVHLVSVNTLMPYLIT